MELLFLYINRTQTKFISNQGFNFSANYNFYVQLKDGKYTLNQKNFNNNLPRYFFDNSHCISNITAIVGENGTGKTTLLNELARDIIVKERTSPKEWWPYYEKEYEYIKRLLIYKQDDRLVCYHNIETADFINLTDLDCTLITQVSESTSTTKSSQSIDEIISRIYLTNSSYSLESTVSLGGNLMPNNLNDASLNTYKLLFYKNKCKINPRIGGGYFEYQLLLCKHKKTTEFQHILDILYLKSLHKIKRRNILISTLKINFTVKFQYFYNVINDNSVAIKTDTTGDINKCFERFKEFKFDTTKDLFLVLYLNLLFELIIQLNKTKDLAQFDIKDKSDVINHIVELIKTEINEDFKIYFSEILEEVKEYEDCLCTCSTKESTMPIGTYIPIPEIIYKSDTYFKFLDLIEKSVTIRKFSFVLRYIEIGGLELASGERALLNFFSRLHLVSLLDISYLDTHPNNKIMISSNINKENWNDNILLLIDEIDLYCHPMWQREILNYLIEEVKLQFKDKKVQIIFTTHSPIVLSDMPKNNVIFLKRDDQKNRCIVDDKRKHSETFGTNIYKLFNDAFFLGEKGQIGRFADNQIQEIIKQIAPKNMKYPKLSDEKYEDLKIRISIIGEEIIRDKLFEMLDRCRYLYLTDKEIKIKIYENRIKRLNDGVKI